MDPKDRLAYFKDNVQDEQDESFDPNQYYYQRDSKDGSKAPGAPMTSQGLHASYASTLGVNGPPDSNSPVFSGQPGYLTGAPGAQPGVGGSGAFLLHGSAQQGAPALAHQGGVLGSYPGAVSRLGGAGGFPSSGPGGPMHQQQQHQQQQQQPQHSRFMAAGTGANGSAGLVGGAPGLGAAPVASAGHAPGPTRQLVAPGAGGTAVGAGMPGRSVMGAIAPSRGGFSDAEMSLSGSASSSLLHGGVNAGSGSGGVGGGPGQEPPFDINSDFPALSGGSSRQLGGDAISGGASKPFAGAMNKPSFTMSSEDFPALPGSGNGGNGGGASDSANDKNQSMGEAGASGSAGFSPGRGQQPHQQGQVHPQQQRGAGVKGSDAQYRFGMLGLLSVIRMTEPDVTTLALGTDLTTLGLNLNSNEPLHASFTSPWTDTPHRRDKAFNLPPCYQSQPPMPPPSAKVPQLADETLFYMFYSMPKDQAQLSAAAELYNREWRYHKEHKLWFTRVPEVEPSVKTNTYERGSYYYFDMTKWARLRKDNFVLSYDMLEDRRAA